MGILSRITAAEEAPAPSFKYGAVETADVDIDAGSPVPEEHWPRAASHRCYSLSVCCGMLLSMWCRAVPSFLWNVFCGYRLCRGSYVEIDDIIGAL